MFTGIIREIGHVVAEETLFDSKRLTLQAPTIAPSLRIGDSVSVNGVCLTVIDHDQTGFSADVMEPTLRLTTLGHLKLSDPVNLEPALAVNERLNGHVVQGHVDGTGYILSIRHEAQWSVMRFSIPKQLARFIVFKGSIAFDGISLTISNIGSNTQEDLDWAEVSLIPETLSKTTAHSLKVGQEINLETDILARHLERLAHFPLPSPSEKSTS